MLNEYDTYTLQIPMHRITGMEIVETLGHIQELRGNRFSQFSQLPNVRHAHEADSIHVGLCVHVVRQGAVRHPLRHEL